MSFWSNFMNNHPNEWENKVKNDFSDKNISDFFWNTHYGKINPFSKTKVALKKTESQHLDQIRWKFTSERLINERILNRLSDGVNSINLKEIKFEKSIFNNVMIDIIENHITLNSSWSINEIDLWSNWALSVKTGTLRMNPFENIFQNYNEKSLISQLETYTYFINSIKNLNLKCLFVPVKKLNQNSSFEIALLGAHLNELIEFHKKNNIEIPKKIIIEVSLDNRYIESVAKIIAIRSVINKIIQVHQLDVIIQIEVSVDKMIFKEKKIDFRLMSITNIAMCSLLGGANSFELSDNLIKSNDAYWRKILVNIPLILKEESYLTNQMYKGAHIIENLSLMIAQKGWEKFKEIESQNGLIELCKTPLISNYVQ